MDLQFKERCIYCGGDVIHTGTESLIKCGLCGNTLVVTGFENEIARMKRMREEDQKELAGFHSQWEESQLEELRRLYHQAENFQYDRVYDKAESYYRQVITKGGGDAEVYWRLLLCHYCVSYQKSGDEGGKLIPIILNPDLTDPKEMSVRKEFAAHARNLPPEQKAVYDEELAKIDRILDKYRQIRGTVSYDVFISVRQQNGDIPTRDSIAAFKLYNKLTEKGLKVFNSRLTPPPAGQEFEPYIISALMSAKVMIVVGTCRENMESQWVRNEWSRFQWLQKSEEKLAGKTDRILLCYLADGMQPNEIPMGLNPNRQAIKEDINAEKQLDQALAFLLPRQEEQPQSFADTSADMPSANLVIAQMKTWLFTGKYNQVMKKYRELTESGQFLDEIQIHLCELCAEKKVAQIEKLVESETDLSQEPLFQLAMELSKGTSDYYDLARKMGDNASWRKKHTTKQKPPVPEVKKKEPAEKKTVSRQAEVKAPVRTEKPRKAPVVKESQNKPYKRTYENSIEKRLSDRFYPLKLLVFVEFFGGTVMLIMPAVAGIMLTHPGLASVLNSLGIHDNGHGLSVLIGIVVNVIMLGIFYLLNKSRRASWDYIILWLGRIYLILIVVYQVYSHA